MWLCKSTFGIDPMPHKINKKATPATVLVGYFIYPLTDNTCRYTVIQYSHIGFKMTKAFFNFDDDEAIAKDFQRMG